VIVVGERLETSSNFALLPVGH